MGGDQPWGDGVRRRARQRFNQLGQPRGSRVTRHSRKARRFLPGIDIEAREGGKDAEPCSVSIFANRRAEEFVELGPDEWRQRRMGHITTPAFSLCSTKRSEAGTVASAL